MKVSLLIMSLILIIFGAGKKWETSFEKVGDFKSPSGIPWYVEGGSAFASAIDTSMETVMHGVWTHKHWILSARADSNTGPYQPHRAYVTIQFQKSNVLFMQRALISIYVWSDVTLKKRPPLDDWFSIATITCDTSDNWSRTILVNLTAEGYIRLVHVPLQGEQTHTYQVTSSNNPTGTKKWQHKKWNRLDIYLDTDPVTGRAIVWQNGILMSKANVRGCSNSPPLTPYINQAHFGLYIAAAVPKATIYNDKLRFIEVADTNASVARVDSLLDSLIKTPW